MRLGIRITVLGALTLIAIAGSASRALAQTQCTIEFDSSCPDMENPECGATFIGGLGCVVAGLGLCYDTGNRSYEIGVTSPLSIALENPISAIDVFFAVSGEGGGTMVFSNDEGPVGVPISADNCTSSMPDRQSQQFSSPVKLISVVASVLPGGRLWLDTLTLTTDDTPIESVSWTSIKSVYR